MTVKDTLIRTRSLLKRLLLTSSAHNKHDNSKHPKWDRALFCDTLLARWFSGLLAFTRGFGEARVFLSQLVLGRLVAVWSANFSLHMESTYVP